MRLGIRNPPSLSKVLLRKWCWIFASNLSPFKKVMLHKSVRKKKGDGAQRHYWLVMGGCVEGYKKLVKTFSILFATMKARSNSRKTYGKVTHLEV